MKNKIFFTLYFKIISFKNNSEKLNDFENKKVLVLAPHVDDDIIGCGGTIYNYSQAGSLVKVVYLTDGSKSNTCLSETALVKKRKEEAKEIASYLGISFMNFLDYPDSELSKCSSELKLDIIDIIEDFKPEIIFAPFVLDKHPDHQAIAILLPQILNSYSGQCYLYDVLYPISHIFINLYSEVDKAIKEKAYAVYSSQPISFTNVLKFECLRSNIFSTCSTCVEVFNKYSREEYEALLVLFDCDS